MISNCINSWYKGKELDLIQLSKKNRFFGSGPKCMGGDESTSFGFGLYGQNRPVSAWGQFTAFRPKTKVIDGAA